VIILKISNGPVKGINRRKKAGAYNPSSDFNGSANSFHDIPRFITNGF
jgi:hypothetical protein